VITTDISCLSVMWRMSASDKSEGRWSVNRELTQYVNTGSHPEKDKEGIPQSG
jgi:hypothetical protein